VVVVVIPGCVPNAPESSGLTPGVDNSVEPSGIPVGPTVLLVVPSGDVALMSGVVVVICAKAMFQPNRAGIVNASNARRMGHLLMQAGSVEPHDPGLEVARNDVLVRLSQLAAL
jgi:hypothetical protein